MIAYLSGRVISKEERSIVLDVSGVGYFVFVPRRFSESVSEEQPVKLFIYTHVREDELSLFGMSTREEGSFFKLLITVSGVGPRLALDIMNAPMKNVRQAIAKKDVAYLTTIPGIGKKTAERIIVDLEGKMKAETLMDASDEGGDIPQQEDIVNALLSLGYHRQQVLQGLKRVPSEVKGEEAIIKYFLQNV